MTTDAENLDVAARAAAQNVAAQDLADHLAIELANLHGNRHGLTAIACRIASRKGLVEQGETLARHDCAEVRAIGRRVIAFGKFGPRAKLLDLDCSGPIDMISDIVWETVARRLCCHFGNVTVRDLYGNLFAHVTLPYVGADIEVTLMAPPTPLPPST